MAARRSARDQAEQHPDRRRLARPVRPEEAVDRAARHGQVHRVDRDLAAGEPLGQPGRCGSRRRSPAGPAGPLGHAAGAVTGHRGHAAAACSSTAGGTAPTSSRPSSSSSTETSLVRSSWPCAVGTADRCHRLVSAPSGDSPSCSPPPPDGSDTPGTLEHRRPAGADHAAARCPAYRPACPAVGDGARRCRTRTPWRRAAARSGTPRPTASRSDTDVNAVSNAGPAGGCPRRSPAPAAGRRSRCRPRCRTSPTSDRVSRGCEHQLVGRPAGDRRGAVDGHLGRGVDRGERLLGGLLRRQRLGASAPAQCSRRLGRAAAACWAVFLPLVHSQTSRPLRTRSVSARSPTRATRALSAPSYQTRAVCDPASSDVGVIERAADVGQRRQPEPGGLDDRAGQRGPGRPSTTSTSSCAADRCGSAGDALATIGSGDGGAPRRRAPTAGHGPGQPAAGDGEVEFMPDSLPRRPCDDAESR